MSKWNLRNYTSELGDYSELRAQQNATFSLAFLNGQMVNNSRSQEQGISARSFVGGKWGFSSHPQIDSDAVKMALSESHKNAKFLSSRSKSTEAVSKMPGARGTIDLSTKKAKWTQQQFTDRMNEIDAYIKMKFPDLSHRSMNVYQQDFIKEGINSEQAETYFHYARSYLFVTLGMNSPSGPVDLRKSFGNKGQLEDTFPTLESIKPELEELHHHVVNKSNGIKPEAGSKEVILHSKLAGILAHEAVGHTVEADIVLAGSVAADSLEQKVASPLVNLVDFANQALGKEVPMPVFFDDEGTAATDTVIIENGILKNFMNNKESAAHFGVKPTGHARAWAFRDEPLIRMRNTAILPGKDKLDDMIKSIDDGYLLFDHGNGQADSTSEFMFAVTLGYEIKKGKLGRALLDSTISGVAFEMLKSVSMVSDEMTWVGSGTCGKKQSMTVGMGGPAVKCRVNIGGK